MKKGFLVFMLTALLAVSGCNWHIPFFGDKKVEQDEPVVQETTQNANEQPQYSGVTAGGNQQYGQQPYDMNQGGGQYGAQAQYGAQQTPYNAYNYGVPAAPPAPPAAPGYQNPYGGNAAPAQPYQQPAAPAYGAYGAQPPMPGGSGYGQASAGTYGAYGAGAAYPQAPMPGQYQTPAAGGAYGANPYQAPAASPGMYGSQQNLLSTPAPGFISTPKMGDSFAFQGIKRKIVFIIHYPQRGLTTNPLDPFSQKIYAQLAASSGILLLPKEAVSTYVSSHQLFIDSLETRTKLAKLGREMGAHAVVLEKVNFLTPPQPGGEGNYQLNLEAIDVSSGYPIKTYTIQGNSYQATPPVDQVIADLTGNLKMIDWYSRLVKVDKGRIFVNAGRLSGLQIGQKLRVYAKGSDVVDPATKMSLGKAQGVLKGIVKVADFFGMDGAICEVVSGKGFAAADMVKAVE
ncbi:MAG: hypothetical protein DRH04_06445 [Deltaproteobacteria bacterium]|nr:MAG: hypothetical protein DRH04_06445 [Deltaproteobacteria bacterium]